MNGRAAVQNVLKKCLTCIHWEGGPFKTPIFAPLPRFAVSHDKPPFTFVGLDYLGPLVIKDGINLIKNWICIFTCLNIRAIHLELVNDMSTEGFILCLRRFIARRGSPNLIISDNASQLKLGFSVIGKIWNSLVTHNDIQTYVANKAIQWKFITDYAPWKGGYYERLVGLTKRSLRKALGTIRTTNIELMTLIVEIEATINSRPLTYVDNDINSGTILTPGHFLSINSKVGVPDIEYGYTPDQESSSSIIESWKKGQVHLNRFWNIWLKEYLPSLRERTKIQMKSIKGEVDRKPRIGEIVIVKEEDMSRGKWKLAKVLSLIKSDVDDIARAAKLQLASRRIIKRPFKLLYPLEVDDEINNENEKEKNDDKDVERSTEKGDLEDGIKIITNQRPLRKTASEAREKIRIQCNDNEEEEQLLS